MPGFADAYGINLPAIDQAVAQKRAYDQAFQQQGALQRFGAQAFAPDATDATRAQAISGLAAVDPAKAVQFQEVFMKMNDAQRQHAKDLNNIIGATAYSLKQLPPEQRAARLQSQIPDLVKSGISMDKIQSVDLSDAGLDGLVSQARTLDQMITQGNADRTFQAGRSDHADTMRHQGVMENIAIQNANKPISVSAGSTLIDPRTHQPIALPNGISGPEASPSNGLHGDEYLKTLSPQIQPQVRALVEGRMQFPSGYALKTPYWQNMLQAVSQYDPSFDAINYNARSKTRSDFTSGKSAQNIKALNTAIGHLGKLGEQIGGTVSTGGYPGATLVNAVGNEYNRASGDAGITNFEQTASALATELTNVFRGSGGAEADVTRYLGQLNSNASKEQKLGAVHNIVGLLNARLDAINERYKAGMGTTADVTQLLDPRAVETLKKWAEDGGGAPAASASGGGNVIHYDAQGNRVQ